MKILRRIQAVVTIIAFITAICLVDSIKVNYKDMWTSFMIIALVILQIIIRALSEEKSEENEKNF